MYYPLVKITLTVDVKMRIPKCSIIFSSQEYIKYRENTLMDLLALNPFIFLDMASFFN